MIDSVIGEEIRRKHSHHLTPLRKKDDFWSVYFVLSSRRIEPWTNRWLPTCVTEEICHSEKKTKNNHSSFSLLCWRHRLSSTIWKIEENDWTSFSSLALRQWWNICHPFDYVHLVSVIVSKIKSTFLSSSRERERNSIDFSFLSFGSEKKALEPILHSLFTYKIQLITLIVTMLSFKATYESKSLLDRLI